MIDSLQDYIRLIEPNPDRYTDYSGLYEILESAYIQLCQNNPYFNVYTEYSYFNVVKEHRIKISKLLNLEGKEYLFSETFFYCYLDRGEFEIHRVDYSNEIPAKEETRKYQFGNETFLVIYNYLRDWFDEILINVKNYNNEQ